MILFAISAIITSLSLFYAYQIHVQCLGLDRELRNGNRALVCLIRDNEGLYRQLVLSREGNDELERRLAEMDAEAIASQSIIAEQDQKLMQLQAGLNSMAAERESTNTALAMQSQEIVRLRGDLGASERKCRSLGQEITRTAKEKEASNATREKYELQVLELSDKLSECHSRLARRSRTNIWVMDGVASYESTGRRRKAPTRKLSRPATDPNKSNPEQSQLYS